MNFIFESSTRVEPEKIKFIFISGHVIFCLWYKHTNYDVLDDFPKISDHFPKNSKDFPKLFRRKDELFRTFLGHFLKITDDNQRFPRRYRWCFDHTATHLSTFLRDYVPIAMVIILVTMATPMPSHVKDKNRIFTECDEEWIFCKRKNPGFSRVFM